MLFVVLLVVHCVLFRLLGLRLQILRGQAADARVRARQQVEGRHLRPARPQQVPQGQAVQFPARVS